VDIGPALAEARTKAGMTIQDVSDRTRIRGKLISDIEHDDYSACGGDFYTRGHIRAIAKAVGTDPVPLIEQYDGNAAAPELDVPEAEPPTRPQPSWPGTGQAEPKRAPRLEPMPGRDPLTNGASGAGQGGSAGVDPAVNGNHASPGTEVTGRPVVDDVAGTDELPRVEEVPGVGRESAAAASEPTAAEELRGGDSATTQELAIGGEAATQRPALWQRPASQAPAGPARLGAASDRLRQSAGGFRRAGADAYRQGVPRVRQAGADAYRRAVPQARRAGEQARRAGEQAVRRAGPWARGTASSVYDRISRVRTADRRLSVVIGAAVVVLVLVFLLIYFLVSGSSPASSRSAPAVSHRTVSRPLPARRTGPSRAARAHSHAAAHVVSPSAGPLRPASVAAFGPGGTGQGDNPQQASLALSGQDGGWHTNWYASANFGNLQSGTGLLLNMGGAVTVTRATVDLGSAAGGVLELRAGDQPVLADLLPVARSSGGGAVTLAPGHPVAARYLLIWFTRLPADSSGTYQAAIYHVRLTGFS
jgi:transcriptional regulator with XRE-family HTH domain